MLSKKFKYNRPVLIGSIVVWELVFWVLIWQLLRIFGVFSKSTVGDQFVFLKPDYGWWCLVIVPVLIAIFLFQVEKRNRLVNRLGDNKTIHSFLNSVSSFRLFWRYFFIRNVFVFTVFALMQPAYGTKTVHGETTGVELIFAVDVSNSMNTRDIKGGESRLTVAKRAMTEMVNQSSASQVGLVIFAGDSYPELPLTPDIDMVKMYIDHLNTSLISNQGTNISAALKSASKFFTKEETRKVLVLITDGEDHEGDMKSAYASLKDKNVLALILGIGTEKGGIVPNDENPHSPPLKDDLGRVVVSKVNFQMIKDIAKELNGNYLLSNESFPNVSQFLTEINNSSDTNTVDLTFEVKKNRYQWPLGLALFSLIVLLAWESLPRKRRIN